MVYEIIRYIQLGSSSSPTDPLNNQGFFFFIAPFNFFDQLCQTFIPQHLIQGNTRLTPNRNPHIQ